AAPNTRLAARTGERPMRTHNPTCLAGPITGTRKWWHMAEGETPDRPAHEADNPAPPLFRAGLVEGVRRDIAAGIYDTPEKWEIALERLRKRLEADERLRNDER